MYLSQKHKLPMLVYGILVPRKENPTGKFQAQIQKRKIQQSLEFSELVKERNIKSCIDILAIAEWTLRTWYFPET